MTKEKTDYQKFLEKKFKQVKNTGFEIETKNLNKNLFDFQKKIVQNGKTRW